MKKIKFLIFFSLFSLFVSTKEYVINPGPEAYEYLQEAMILMSSGDSILIKGGDYYFEDSLSLDVDDVVIRGEGLNNTILNFENQKSGAQGILVTSNKVVLKDFAVIDAKGDAIKVIGADGIAMINLRTEWTGGLRALMVPMGFIQLNLKMYILTDVLQLELQMQVYMWDSLKILLLKIVKLCTTWPVSNREFILCRCIQ